MIPILLLAAALTDPLWFLFGAAFITACCLAMDAYVSKQI